MPAELGEGLDEASICDREALLFVEPHAQKTDRAPFDHQRHGPQRLRASAAGRHARHLRKDRGIFLFGLGPNRDARGQRLEHARVAFGLADAHDFLQHLGRHPALREQVQRFAAVVEHVQRRDVRARLTHALLDHQVRDLALAHRAGERERKLGQALQARQRHAQLLGIRRTFGAHRVVHSSQSRRALHRMRRAPSPPWLETKRKRRRSAVISTASSSPIRPPPRSSRGPRARGRKARAAAQVRQRRPPRAAG